MIISYCFVVSPVVLSAGFFIHVKTLTIRYEYNMFSNIKNSITIVLTFFLRQGPEYSILKW